MSNRIPISISLILGIGLLTAAGSFSSNTRQLLSAAKKAPGIVVGFERRPSKGGSTNYAVVEFALPSGEMRRFTTCGPGDYVKGATVEVVYKANDPAKAKVNGFLELWLGSLALGAFGLMCLGVGLGTWLYDRAHLKTKGER